MIAKIIKYSLLLPLNLIYFISFLTPKKKGLWLFSSWFGEKYLDNPKYIFQEVLKNEHNVKPYWLVKDKALLEKLLRLGYPAVNTLSIKGFWLQLRAEAIIFSHSVGTEFLSSFISPKTKRILTWHGIPIKKIGLDNQNKKRIDKTIIMNIFLPFLKEDYDLITAVGREDKKSYHSAFKSSAKKISITGYPRNDQLFSLSNKPSANADLNIIYMPTLRGGVNSEFRLLSDGNFDFKRIDKLLMSLNAKLFIKLHPVQVFTQRDSELIKESKNIIAILNEEDIYNYLGSYDVLITDYSGIFFDFMITGKPIIMAPIDYENYTKDDREVYYDYNSICPMPPCNNWDEIMKAIKLVKDNKYVTNNYYKIQRNFHKYLDKNSSLRVIDEVKKL